MFYMETVYLQMAASRALAKERLRGHNEHEDRPKVGLLAQAHSSQEATPRQTGPYTGFFPNGPWRIERWRGAGW